MASRVGIEADRDARQSDDYKQLASQLAVAGFEPLELARLREDARGAAEIAEWALRLMDEVGHDALGVLVGVVMGWGGRRIRGRFRRREDRCRIVPIFRQDGRGGWVQIDEVLLPPEPDE